MVSYFCPCQNMSKVPQLRLWGMQGGIQSQVLRGFKRGIYMDYIEKEAIRQ